MQSSSDARPLWWTLSAVWVAILVCGVAFVRQQQIPFGIALAAALIAGVLEASFYAASGFAVARQWVRELPHRSLWIAASTLPPFLIYSLGMGFRWQAFLVLVALAAAMAWWFEVLPASNWTDGGFLAIIACGLLFELSGYIYPALSKQLKTDYIGHIMWLRLSFWALLVVRDRGDMGFGFIPTRKDWVVGGRYFVYCVPVAAVVLWLVQPMRIKDHLSWSLTPLVAVGTFVGFLWVVALSEELFARGVLQGDLSSGLKNAWLGLVITSILFGLVHLNLERKFPNWRAVLLAGLLGLFCGRAAQVAGSIRASMVTHALVVTVYRVFLSK